MNISKNQRIKEKIPKGDILTQPELLIMVPILSFHKDQIPFNIHQIHIWLSMYIKFKSNVMFAFGYYTFVVKV